MTATLLPPPDVGAAESVSTTLSLVHDQWIARIAHLLAPATLPRAGFWERWDAVRFLTDQFDARFRLERALVESMPQLPASVRARLEAHRAALELTRDELIAAGRRRGTGAQVAMLARRFLDQARRWCAALELATATLTPDDLSARSRDILARLRAAAVLEL